jgi:prefoldin subunit 5
MTQKGNIDQYTPQELYQIKQGFEGEITTLGQSMNQLRFALEKYEEGKRSIRAVEECKDDEELLMPLSNSLYIQGYLNNRANVDLIL